nr:P-loop NTPase fold protein [uncultured Oscillibacter sp.]
MVDILDRQETVRQLMDLLNTLADARASCSFALNGKWGTGKTFVLNMLEENLREYQAGEKFLVFHYNCWQYDYYDEPLIAIVSAMLDGLEENVHLLPQGVCEAGKESAQAVIGEVLKTIASSFLKNKIGIDAETLSKTLKIAQDAVTKAFEKEHGYDNYYAFHKTLEDAKTELSKITEYQTLVIVVDELDRCLPDYALKTLERLHHLFAGMDSTVLLMALDKGQLENTVQQIFGKAVDCDAYLKKFIDFELKLDIGKVNNRFLEKYSDYTALFDQTALEPWAEFDRYIALLFSEIEVRRQEHLIQKVKMVHELLFGGQEKKDISFLCFELLMAVFEERNAGATRIPLFYGIIRAGQYELAISDSLPASLADYIKKEWIYMPSICHDGRTSYLFFGEGTLVIPQLLIGYSDGIYHEGTLLAHHSETPKFKKYIQDFKAMKRILNIIA